MDLKTLNKFGFLEIALSKKHLKKINFLKNPAIPFVAKHLTILSYFR
ncbi:hypothetical protein BPUTSESOX_2087 [uncultured Gammaproteobacteria bacterium]|jgi:hypothetical protein|nr:hypothetical protein [thiotrophic endosymbiont of Bathymodiolus puteoserpentis (Logatchev)]CAC9484920.1 hypothetical protein [uncultured Gammaproteobacteria bacterium]CAC9579756.1 hypothetical protein [uncultured Gammaproteobacteria bacterium]CAC9580327.1 hypothetical protein [uncultured Gammaproteobacteria bacterium]CAC9629876.1 hypothetical protein [uncultured Gammaproteobacteria bacterium]CAC9636652.1 hypothetical protein [uncultured Gammaproteobacteria bacterium]